MYDKAQPGANTKNKALGVSQKAVSMHHRARGSVLPGRCPALVVRADCKDKDMKTELWRIPLKSQESTQRYSTNVS